MSSRPTTPPDWATDTDYAAGSDDWSGQPNKVSPGALVNSGFIPKQFMAAEHMNFQLGNHGDWIKYLGSLVDIANRDAFWFVDDFFVGWGPATIAADLVGDVFRLASPTNATLIEDYDASSPGGFGVVFFTQTGSGIVISTAQTRTFPVGTNDFILSMRVRISVKANLNNHATFYLSGGARSVGFQAQTSEANWQYIDDSNALQDTGVPVVDGDYIDLQAIRIGGTLEYFINGTSIDSFSSSTLGAGSRVGLTFLGVDVGAANEFGSVDYAKLWVAR